jgi:hypothetical protein
MHKRGHSDWLELHHDRLRMLRDLGVFAVCSLRRAPCTPGVLNFRGDESFDPIKHRRLWSIVVTGHKHATIF